MDVMFWVSLPCVEMAGKLNDKQMTRPGEMEV